MLKAVIMDFDGLIVDTEVVYYKIYASWFKKHKNYNLSIEDFLICVGSHPEELFVRMEKDFQWSIDRQEFTQATQAEFLAESQKLPAKKGVVKFISSVKHAGLKLALATSAPRLKPEQHLTRLGLIDQFDLLVTADDVERIKPYPDLFLAAADKLKIDPAEALIIEDSLNGLKAGQNASMRVMVVPNDVTKHCHFDGYYQKVNSLAQANLSSLIAAF